jgi:membrane-associated protein
MMRGDCRYTVLLTVTALLPFTSLSISDQILQYGIWVYLLVFLIIMLASTIVGGPIPDNTFLVMTGAVAMDSGLSMGWLFIVAAGGGVAGYEINYWSGRLFGLTICQESCPLVLQTRNVQKAIDLMDRFGPVAMVLSRFMPVLNLPSFIAGVNGMEYRRFVGFNLISSAVWCGILLVLGYYIGSISIVSIYLDYFTDIIIVIVVTAIIIALAMFVRDYLKRPRIPSLE